jgi:hypothetical protein
MRSFEEPRTFQPLFRPDEEQEEQPMRPAQLLDAIENLIDSVSKLTKALNRMYRQAGE